MAVSERILHNSKHGWVWSGLNGLMAQYKCKKTMQPDAEKAHKVTPILQRKIRIPTTWLYNKQKRQQVQRAEMAVSEKRAASTSYSVLTS